MLELRNIAKVAGADTHIHPTNLVLERGSLNVLLGPTLSGKTSLMRLMAGLDKPTAGSVWFDGKDVTGVRVQDRGVAMVYQQFINYPALTVYENIASPMRIKGADSATIDREVRKAADLLKLTPYLDRTPLNLSGGQQQRTALARAIVKNASLVLLDEPLANLDYKLREELRLELPKIFAASGAIFVYATTEPSEALLLGGNTATLSQGRITQFGPTIEVYRRPNDLVTARTFAPGDHGGTRNWGRWRWRGPARTLLWGWMQRSRISAVWLVNGGARTRLSRSLNGTFGAVLPATTTPRDLRIELDLRHGGKVTLRGGQRSKGYVR